MDWAHFLLAVGAGFFGGLALLVVFFPILAVSAFFWWVRKG